MRIELSGKLIFPCLAALVILTLLVPRAHAGDWWMVYGWGQKPNRTLVFVDVLRTRDMGFFTASTAAVVYESPNEPDYSLYEYNIHCNTNQFQEALNSTLWRNPVRRIGTEGDDRLASKQPKQAAEPGSWRSRVVEFACKPASRTLENGMAYAGEATVVPVDLAWNVWGSEHRPPYVSGEKVTPEEFERRKAAALAQVDQLQAENTALGKDLMKDVAEREAASKDEHERLDARMKIVRKSSGSTQMAYMAMETWIGSEEQELLTRWGAPNRSQQSSDLMFHTYTWGHSSTGVNGFGAVVSQATYRCDATFILRANKVIDVRVGGNNCEKIRPR